MGKIMKTHISLIFVVMMGLMSGAQAQSSLTVDVKLKPAGTFQAKTTKIKGSAHRTEGGVAAENIVIDVASLSTGISMRDKHLKDHLEVATYPTAKLIKAVGKQGKGKGIIEIKGQKQDVDGTYTIDGHSLIAKFKMQLSKLKITDVRYMGVGVADEVQITIKVPLK